ncbi:MAG: IS481 family transposase [Candidatus Paceibacterota bacterium]
MSKSIQEERWRWVEPIINQEIKLTDVAKVCPYSKRSLKRWKKAYLEHGMDGLVPKSTRPKTQPNETPIRTKETVIALRKETGLCAQKLHWRLKKTGLVVPVRTIGKILKDAGLVRKYRKKKVKYKYLKAERQPGELLEIDVKHVPGKLENKRYFQYTAIDTASRWRYLRIYDEQSSFHSVEFLKEVRKRFPYPVQAIKTDNHSTFTNYYLGTNKRSDLRVKRLHALDVFCAKHDTVHYLIDPGKPAQNGTVERSHREDEEKFYQKQSFRNQRELEEKLRVWNTYYNNLEHCSLDGRTPNEMLRLEKVPNVLA